MTANAGDVEKAALAELRRLEACIIAGCCDRDFVLKVGHFLLVASLA